MTKFKVEFEYRALKEFSKLDRPVQVRIKAKIELLAGDFNSMSSNLKQLKGVKDLYRMRVADYRVVFKKYDEKITILIVRIGHRREVYT